MKTSLENKIEEFNALVSKSLIGQEISLHELIKEGVVESIVNKEDGYAIIDRAYHLGLNHKEFDKLVELTDELYGKYILSDGKDKSQIVSYKEQIIVNAIIEFDFLNGLASTCRKYNLPKDFKKHERYYDNLPIESKLTNFDLGNMDEINDYLERIKSNKAFIDSGEGGVLFGNIETIDEEERIYLIKDNFNSSMTKEMYFSHGPVICKVSTVIAECIAHLRFACHPENKSKEEYGVFVKQNIRDLYGIENLKDFNDAIPQIESDIDTIGFAYVKGAMKYSDQKRKIAKKYGFKEELNKIIETAKKDVKTAKRLAFQSAKVNWVDDEHPIYMQKDIKTFYTSNLKKILKSDDFTLSIKTFYNEYQKRYKESNNSYLL